MKSKLVEKSIYPFNAAGRLISTFLGYKGETKTVLSMGFYIGIGTVMTTASSIYQRDQKKIADSIYFYPFQKDQEGKQVRIQIQSYQINQYFINSWGPQIQSNNIAIIKLVENQNIIMYQILSIDDSFNFSKDINAPVEFIGWIDSKDTEKEPKLREGVIIQSKIPIQITNSTLIIKTSKYQYKIIGIHTKLIKQANEKSQQKGLIGSGINLNSKESQKTLSSYENGLQKFTTKQKQEKKSQKWMTTSVLKQKQPLIGKLQYLPNFSQDKQCVQRVYVKPYYFNLRKHLIANEQQEMTRIQFQVDLQKQQNNTKRMISHDDIDPNIVSQLFGELYDKSPKIASILCHQILQSRNTKQEQKRSKIIHQKYQKTVQQQLKDDQQPVTQTSILILKKHLEMTGINVELFDKSTVKSQLSMKVISQKFLTDYVRVQTVIKQGEYQFQRLDNKNYMNKFLQNYKRKVQKQLSIDMKDVVIQALVKGSIQVYWIMPNGRVMLDALQDIPPNIQNHYKIFPFFEHLGLSEDDFDRKGDIKFFDSKHQVQFRGGWPYYQPVKCKRFGIKVSKEYDGQIDKWLQMKNSPGQWAVAFHGIQFIDGKRIQQIKKTNKQIMHGRSSGQMLQVGRNQAYNQSQAVNWPAGTKVQKGIYCTPHIQDAFPYTYDVKLDCLKNQYCIILQCRVNPKHIKVCDGKEQYWVINKSKDIRPYGIILLEKTVKLSYPKIQQQFSSKFKFNNFKSKIASDNGNYVQTNPKP